MTVSSTNTKNSYSGNGSTTVFAYTFKIFDDDDITVILRTDATGGETVQTKTTDYTVSGVGNAGGGNITFGTAPASGITVVLLRETAQTQATDYTPNDPFPAASHEDALDKLTLIIQDQQEELDRAIKVSRTNTITSSEFTVGASTRANKIFAFDSSGDLAVTQEIGTYQGTDATTTTSAYAERDIVKSTTAAQLNNVYICIQASPAGTLLTNTSYWQLLVDAVTAATSATNAAASATAAAASETAAAASESAAATSETNAATSASNASTSATNAATSATASAASASAASTSETNAATSATNASTSATAAASSATAAASSATAAAASESAAATSETNAATSASNAATSETNAATSESNAATSASNAATSASNAANAQTAAEAARDAIQQFYLGAQSSNPTVDGNGDPVTAGDWYFNTTDNTTRIYDGSAWNTVSPDLVGDTTPQLGGNLDTNGNDITGTGNINLTGTVTADGLTVDGNATLGGVGDTVLFHTNNGVSPTYFSRSTVTNEAMAIGVDDADVILNSIQDERYGGYKFQSTFNGTGTRTRMEIVQNSGDISFYDSTGVTQGLFWDASAQSLGLGTTSPSSLLHLSTSDPRIRITDTDTAGTFELRNTSNVAYISNLANAAMLFSTNSLERMRIDSSGNVGIGTSSPAHALSVFKDSDGNRTEIGIDNVDQRLVLGAYFESGVGQYSTIQSTNDAESSATSLVLQPDGGNVGIGTSSPAAKLQIDNAAASHAVLNVHQLNASYNTDISLFNQANTTSTTLISKRTDGGLWLYQSGADYIAAYTNSTERMRIDSSGNVGIGTSSPSKLLSLQTSTQYNGISLSNGTNTVGEFVGFAAGNDAGGLKLYNGGVATAEVQASGITFFNGGNVGIGTTSPSHELTVSAANDSGVRIDAEGNNVALMLTDETTSNGFRFNYNAPNDVLTLDTTNGTGAKVAERMRIDSSGNLLVGYTSSNGAYKLQVNSQIFATSATIATSDGNYKENVTPLDGVLSLVSQLNPVQFDWKEHPVHEFDRNQPTIGFIAQEVQQVLAEQPYLNSIVKSNECVLEPEETDDEGNVIKEAVTEPFLGIAEGNMVALLTAAIKEQQATITALEARIAALEAN